MIEIAEFGMRIIKYYSIHRLQHNQINQNYIARLKNQYEKIKQYYKTRI